MKKICFKDVDGWLKVSILTGWITAFVWVVIFLSELAKLIVYG